MSLQIPPESSTPAHQQQQRNYPQSAGPSYHTQRPTSLASPQYSSHSNSRGGDGQGHTYNAMPMPPTQSPAPGAAPPSSSSRRQQQRATHTVALSPNQREQQNQPATAHPNSNQSTGNPASGSAAAGQAAPPDVYAHPAALAYAAAHPRRTIPKFGPYLLLQTLGEGEFGKVKLGLHSQWGEEVAVKLIRRGNVDTTTRMSKIEREIEVLKTLKHPNIVRLYDVIETDKYIGIILEYASGGELFDHILAHRYLREKDAAKLFSQLISGVWYIHQKKIVHRDLKLENLLLDRNRNVIITDFGFANRFEHKSDDLMQTSCGSPCYAAPELVISEGLYVGSAVDIWSCGVILYAMLAGYLPFDDDPANPDGDNINLLYKYIVSTPLSFPDYISAEARDLLSMMLVPDPKRRTTLDGVMRHTWLKPYWGTLRTDGQPNAFGKTVEDLEKHAMEQHQLKRVAYQRQMRQQAQAAQGGSGQQAGGSGSNTANPHVAPTPSRAQSHRPEARSERSASSNIVPPIVTNAVASQVTNTVPTPTRSRSTQPEYLYESSPSSPVTGVVVDPSVSLLTSPPPSVVSKPTTKPQPATPQNKESPGQKKFASPAALGLSEDDPFAFGVGAAPASNTAITITSNATSSTLSPPGQSPEKGEKEKKGHGAFRHTIQVEYDSEPKERGRRHPSGGRPRESPRREKEERKEVEQNPDEKVLPSPPAAPPPPAPSAYRAPVVATAPPVPAPVSIPPVQIPAAPALPATPVSAISEANSNTSSVGKSQGGHKKGKSSVDRMGLGKIFGGLGGSGDKDAKEGSPSISATPSTASAVSQADSSMDTSNDGEKREKTKEERKREEKEEKRKNSGRRNTLTVMVEPLSRSIRNRSQNQKTPISSVYPEGTPSAGLTTAIPATAKNASLQPPPMPTSMPFPPGAARSTSMNSSNASASLLNSATPSTASSAANSASFSPSQDFGDVPRTASERAGMQASTSKAKKVMQWFRSKSKGRESLASYSVTPSTEDDIDKDNTPTQTQTQASQTPIANRYQKGYSVSSSTVNQPAEKEEKEKEQNLVAPPVQVVVTTPTSSVARPAPPPPVRSETTAAAPPVSTATTPVTSSFVSRFRNSVTVGSRDRERQRQTSTSSNKLGAFYGFNSSSSSTAQAQQTPPHPYAQLRIHHGAVDQTTITTRPPPEVMAHVRKVLESMGVEAQLESEYKVRCVRVKKKKDVVIPSGSAVEGEAGGPPGLAVITMMGSAASNGVDKRGLPLPSPSGTFSASTGGMLRGLLMRRQSSQVASGVPPTLASHGPSNTLAFDDEHSVVVGEPISTIGNGGLVASPNVDPITPVMSPGQGAFPFTTGSTSGAVGPAYGDPSQDAGDEVRFSVELTRLDRLNDTYSLDIRRLKGNLRSYKFLYDTLRQRADLSAARA